MFVESTDPVMHALAAAHVEFYGETARSSFDVRKLADDFALLADGVGDPTVRDEKSVEHPLRHALPDLLRKLHVASVDQEQNASPTATDSTSAVALSATPFEYLYLLTRLTIGSSRRTDSALLKAVAAWISDRIDPEAGAVVRRAMVRHGLLDPQDQDVD